MQLVNMVISAILQIILFSIIPFIWWMITARKDTSFLTWLGFKKIKATNKRNFRKAFFGTLLLFLIVSMFILYMTREIETATAQFLGLGFSALLSAIMYSFVQTAFSEELFFRGFLAKRLINKFGFNAGNLTQGLLFGIIHGVMFYGSVQVMIAVIITLFTCIIAVAMGYINEKLAGGAIWPSWLIHGISNFFATLVALFS